MSRMDELERNRPKCNDEHILEKADPKRAVWCVLNPGHKPAKHAAQFMGRWISWEDEPDEQT